MTTADDMQVGGDHYQKMAVQPWAAMEAWMTREQFAGFLLGNCIKYLARHGRKGAALEDLRKARHYLDKLIAVSERVTPERSATGKSESADLARTCRTCRHDASRGPAMRTDDYCYGCGIRNGLEKWQPSEVAA